MIFLSPYDQLRRATLLFRSELPTPSEINSVDEDVAALDDIYDTLMKEDKFYAFLERGWNDLLHTRGVLYPLEAIDEESFPSKRWYAGLPDGEKNTAIYYAAQGVRYSPVKLISHIVRNDLPFTEILTANYEMVNSFSAKSFGVFEQLSFESEGSYNQYLPAVFPVGEKTGLPDGNYHSGLLSSTILWKRHVSTDTNLNRARTRFLFKLFLDTDILELAPLASDADRVVEFDNPIKDFNQCNVCHIPMDPVAGLLQNFTNAGHRRPFEGTWDPSYMPGFNGVNLPDDRSENPEKWLGEQLIKDRRFPLAMVANTYFILTGRERMRSPTDVSSRYFSQHHRAFEEQHKEINRIASLFIDSNYDYKVIVKEWWKSPFLIADNLNNEPSERRAAELQSLGLTSIVTPEELVQKILAIFRRGWTMPKGSSSLNFLSHEVGYYINDSPLYFLFDGIDSREVTRRLKTPNGVMGAVTNFLAEDHACQNTALDFARPIASRVLFPFNNALDKDEDSIRKGLVYLYERVLGLRLKKDALEINAAYQLWQSIQKEGENAVILGTESPQMMLECISQFQSNVTSIETNLPDGDPLYTIRAWQAVLVYLLSDFRFYYK